MIHHVELKDEGNEYPSYEGKWAYHYIRDDLRDKVTKGFLKQKAERLSSQI